METVSRILERYKKIKFAEAKKQDKAYSLLMDFPFERMELLKEGLTEYEGPLAETLSGVLPGKTREARKLAIETLDELLGMPLKFREKG